MRVKKYINPLLYYQNIFPLNKLIRVPQFIHTVTELYSFFVIMNY